MYLHRIGSQAYEAVSGTTTQGIDLEADRRNPAELAGSSQLYPRLASGSGAAATLNTSVPQNTVKLFTSYRWPGADR